MSLCLFNIYIDDVVRESNTRILDRGLSLVNSDDREWKISQLLFADDIALVADSEEKLCPLVKEFGQVCRRKNLRVDEN